MALDQFLSAIMLVEKLERFLVAHQLQFGHNQLFDLCRKRRMVGALKRLRSVKLTPNLSATLAMSCVP